MRVESSETETATQFKESSAEKSREGDPAFSPPLPQQQCPGDFSSPPAAAYQEEQQLAVGGGGERRQQHKDAAIRQQQQQVFQGSGRHGDG